MKYARLLEKILKIKNSLQIYGNKHMFGPMVSPFLIHLRYNPMKHLASASGSSFLKEGLSAGWPICLGYLPIGMAFGVLSQKAGLTPLQIGLMSILVFAGSSQFIAVSMLTAGASAPAIIATTFVVNLRHVLMSSALAVYLRAAHRGLLALYAYGVTDESFAVNLPRFSDNSWNLSRALVVNHTANLTWFVSTVTGGIGGRFIPEGTMGIDYALIAMFICLLIYQIKNPIQLLAALIAGLTAVGLALMIPGNSYIVIASVAAATVGVIIQRKLMRPNSEHG
jgi:4-azaleucine resistance transporter AzlC